MLCLACLIQAVGATVENADRLLDIWIKVLSQSEHTQRLLLDGKWQGSTAVSLYPED
jgi:DASH complex subunit Duo1